MMPLVNVNCEVSMLVVVLVKPNVNLSFKEKLKVCGIALKSMRTALEVISLRDTH